MYETLSSRASTISGFEGAYKKYFKLFEYFKYLHYTQSVNNKCLLRQTEIGEGDKFEFATEKHLQLLIKLESRGFQEF